MPELPDVTVYVERLRADPQPGRRQLASLREAAIEVLSEWTERLRKESGPTLPRPT